MFKNLCHSGKIPITQRYTDKIKIDVEQFYSDIKATKCIGKNGVLGSLIK